MSSTESITLGTVPLIDLERWRQGDPETRHAIETEVDRALTDVGFLILTGHGISNDLIDEVRRTCADVFAMPSETKDAYRQTQGIGAAGWTPIGSEANAYASGEPTPPDLKESWTVAPTAPGAVGPTSLGLIPVENKFPAEVPDFEPAARDYMDAGLALSQEIFELLAWARGVEPDTFTRLCSEPLHTLNLTWYPPLVDGDQTVEAEPNQFRIGPHSDFGTITILHREPSDPPLQVQLPDGGWEDLPHIPDALIVNTGDQLAYWSGGRWRSNPHRIPAPEGDAAKVGRLSLVLFLETNVGAMLDPIGRPDDPPMDADAYLIDKLVAIDTAM